MSQAIAPSSNNRGSLRQRLSRATRPTLLLIAIQIGLLGAMAAWMGVEEVTQPRGWAPAAPVDPELPIRGRYVSLVLRVPAPGMAKDDAGERVVRVALRVRNGRVYAVPASPEDGNPRQAWRREATSPPAVDLSSPLAFFLPEHSADPSRRQPGETLWAEVVLPRWGPPRPLRLGVERRSGRIEPLPSR